MYRDNRAKSSANFYKAFAAGIWHNTRFGNKPFLSFAEYEHRNIANLSFEAAKEIEAKLLEERSQKYMETHNQKFQCKTAFIELVVNMREHHTLADLGLIAELVEKLSGIPQRCSQFTQTKGTMIRKLAISSRTYTVMPAFAFWTR